MKIIINGSSRGIGLFLMKNFIQTEYKVFGTYNKTKPPYKLAENFSKVDITNSFQVHRWIKSIVCSDDRIVLINCSGINYNEFAHKAELKKWEEVINVNLIGTFIIINAILPLMRKIDFGRIINFSSVIAQKGIPGTSAYAASKAALWGMTKSIATENAKKGITINNLNLGYFDIGMISDVSPQILDSVRNNVPSHKLGNPKNILNAVMFLINSDYITGASLDINGGFI
jgi:NAD(P)-dependent dehydrogenase (short-subunit alcohol dehydrogenase family)